MSEHKRLYLYSHSYLSYYSHWLNYPILEDGQAEGYLYSKSNSTFNGVSRMCWLQMTEFSSLCNVHTEGKIARHNINCQAGDPFD